MPEETSVELSVMATIEDEGKGSKEGALVATEARTPANIPPTAHHKGLPHLSSGNFYMCISVVQPFEHFLEDIHVSACVCL